MYIFWSDPVGCRAFGAAVIANLGRSPSQFPVAAFQAPERQQSRWQYTRKPAAKKELVGVDVFVHTASHSPSELADWLVASTTPAFNLQMITNRGVKVWPEGFPETFCSDHWRCRFVAADKGAPVTHLNIVELTASLAKANVDFIKTENLCTFDGELGYALGQGQ
jgi:isocitrate dehydrogenase